MPYVCESHDHAANEATHQQNLAKSAVIDRESDDSERENPHVRTP